MEQTGLARKLTALQIRMARVGANMTVRELATEAGLNKATVVRVEAGMNVKPGTYEVIREILEARGAQFLECQNSDRIAVSFPKPEVVRPEDQSCT